TYAPAGREASLARELDSLAARAPRANHQDEGLRDGNGHVHVEGGDEPTPAPSSPRSLHDARFQPMGSDCSRDCAEREERIVGAVIAEQVVSETGEVAPQLAATPTRQSGQESLFGFTAWRLGPIISDHPLAHLRLYEPRWVWPPSFRHTEQYL